MAIRTFQLDGHTFISGLFWQPLSHSSSARADIQRIAVEQNLDLAVTRTTGVFQVGLGALADGAREGMLSTAAAVSKSMEVVSGMNSFLCAVAVPGSRDSWLYVAQADAIILHDGDMIGSEDEVRAKLLSDQSLKTDWSVIVAPDHWAIDAAKERSFESFLPEKSHRRGGSRRDFRKWWALKPVKRNVSKLAIRIGGAALLAAIALKGWQSWQTRIQQEELAKQLAAAERETAEAREAAAMAAKANPWARMPAAVPMTQACMNALWQAPLWSAWEPKEAVCTGSVLTVTLIRNVAGTINTLLKTVPTAVPAQDGNSATVSIGISGLTAGDDDVAPIAAERRQALMAVGQDYGVPLTVAGAPTAPTALPGDAPAGAAKPDWSEWAWSVQGATLPPEALAAVLDGAAFRITRLKAVFSGPGVINWTMEGIQYAKP